jgi:hypothetical protein
LVVGITPSINTFGISSSAGSIVLILVSISDYT